MASCLMLFGSLFLTACKEDPEVVDGPLPLPDVPSCEVANNADAMTRRFHIDTLQIPAVNTLGFNLDGLATTSEKDVAGCGKVDGQPGGIDNSLALIIKSLAPTLMKANVNINTELQAAITRNSINLVLEIDHWNGTSTDDCIGVSVSGSSAGQNITPLTGSAALANGEVAQIAFAQSLRIVPTFQLRPDGGLGACEGAGCVTKELPLTISGARAHLKFNANMSALEYPTTENQRNNANSTILGGQVRYTGEASDGAFQPGLQELVAGIDPSLTDLVDGIFAGFLDLDTTPTLSACSQTAGMISADSFSAGILVSGAQVVP